MTNFKVLTTETRGGYVTQETLAKILSRIIEEGGILKGIRTATCRGYISRRSEESYICSYSGRYGTGITLRESSVKSSTYCDKSYAIYDNISKEKITNIIESEIIKSQFYNQKNLHTDKEIVIRRIK